MGELVVVDSLSVPTSLEPCLVELCVGTVTALKVEEYVDVLVVSAFPGEYSPVPRSVVGALHDDLGISVKSLADDKKEDLRKCFSCWWSKPLQEGLPYGQILCFEGSFHEGRGPPATVGEVFRSLLSLPKDKDMRVMMPLLASGNQGYDDRLMLRLIVDTAVCWMLTGLPLKILKVVVFSKTPHEPSAKEKKVIDNFGVLKRKWLSKWEEETENVGIAYDLYISYNPKDSSLVQKIKDALMKKNKTLRIFDKHQEIDPGKAWQESISQVISACSQVIALLTPNYILRDSCLEQFNIAMCRSRKNNILRPLYMKEIKDMPTYIGLIQYMDCRSLDNQVISKACNMFSVSQVSYIPAETLLSATPSTLPEMYDVFVSYAHKDSEIAMKIIKNLKKKGSTSGKWNIFFDQNDLHVGTAWQLKLYTSVENTQFVLALVSQNYMESKVCQEEYNLALALHDDPEFATTLMEIKLSETDTEAPWCMQRGSFDLSNNNDVKKIIKVVTKSISTKLTDMSHKRRRGTIPISKITCNWRSLLALQGYPLCLGTAPFDSTEVKDVKYIADDRYDVILSHHSKDQPYADILVRHLHKLIPSLKISQPVDKGSLRLKEIDDGSLVVPLLSDDYCSSPKLMEEFHTALCRHRFAEEIHFFPITVTELSSYPVYPLLVFNLFNVTDHVWSELAPECYEEKCLETAAAVICNILVRDPKVSTSFRALLSVKELQLYTEKFSLKKGCNKQLPIAVYSKENDSNIKCTHMLADISKDHDEVGGIEVKEVENDVKVE